LQGHWHLIHWPEARECLVPVLVGGWRFEFRLYRIARDEAFERQVLEDTYEWWDRYVRTNTPPPATAQDIDWLRGRYPTHTAGKAIASTPEIERLAREYKAAHARLDEAEEEKKAAGARLRELLGDAEMVKADWGKVTWKNNQPTFKTQWESLAIAMGATAAQIAEHTQQQPGARILRISLAKGV
jgi:predicted phage-related endonuclease